MNTTTPVQTPQMPPEAFILNLTFGSLLTQALYVAAKAGIANQLKDGPKPVSALAAAAEMNEGALYRILRTLASTGTFTETEPRTFANTPYSEVLRPDVPTSMYNTAIFMGEEWHWRVWGNMMESAKTGKPAWGYTHGEEVFDYFAQNPRQAEIFNNTMTDISKGSAFATIEAFDFSGIETLADIAGGHGFMLSQILKANPGIKGILFDMPHVLAGADAILETEGVSGRVKKIPGDFFKEVPAADTYIMKHIIHDWDDEKSLMILNSINRAMIGNGRVLLVEVVVPEGNEPHYSKLLDLEMLVSPGGLERTAAEYAELFEKAGFKLNRIVPTKSPFSVIEAVKA